MAGRLKILFVCGKNQWRSPTAERIYRNDPRVSVRSAGVSGRARREVTDEDLDWADLVLVMEKKHWSRMMAQFRFRSYMPPVDCLDIPDEYQFMDPELVELIRGATEFHIDARKKA